MSEAKVNGEATWETICTEQNYIKVEKKTLLKCEGTL